MNRILLGIIKRNIKPIKSAKDHAFVELYSMKLREGDIAIDCGANVGKVSAHWCQSGATVYAFEPNPHAFKILDEKLSGRPNAHCFQKAVLDRNDKVKLYYHLASDENELRWSTGSSLLRFKANVLQDKFAEVEAIDLAEFVNALDHDVKILKLDVEGVECAILRKLIESEMHMRIGRIFVETHENQAPELQEETDELRALIKSMNITNINMNW